MHTPGEIVAPPMAVRGGTGYLNCRRLVGMRRETWWGNKGAFWIFDHQLTCQQGSSPTANNDSRSQTTIHSNAVLPILATETH